MLNLDQSRDCSTGPHFPEFDDGEFSNFLIAGLEPEEVPLLAYDVLETNASEEEGKNTQESGYEDLSATHGF